MAKNKEDKSSEDTLEKLITKKTNENKALTKLLDNLNSEIASIEDVKVKKKKRTKK